MCSGSYVWGRCEQAGRVPVLVALARIPQDGLILGKTVALPHYHASSKIGRNVISGYGRHFELVGPQQRPELVNILCVRQ